MDVNCKTVEHWHRGRKRALQADGAWQEVANRLINRLIGLSVDNYRARKCNVPTVEQRHR